MLESIQLNIEQCLNAEKIQNVRRIRMLAPEFVS